MIGLTLIATVLVSCDYRTAEQDVMDTVSPDGYPVATFSTDFTGTEITEGDTILYTVVFDKTIDRAVTFRVTQTDGDAMELDDHDHGDYVATAGVLQPYTLETEVSLVVLADDDPEDAETLSFEIGATTVADKYLVNQSVVNPTHALTVNNLNDPTLLTIKFEWDNDNDYDLVTGAGFSDGDTIAGWGSGGATGANPEFDMSIWLADPTGDYSAYILEWGYGESFSYELTLGLPDGTNQVIEGSFDPETAMDDFETDVWPYWAVQPAFKILDIEVDGSDAFTITVL